MAFKTTTNTKILELLLQFDFFFLNLKITFVIIKDL